MQEQKNFSTSRYLTNLRCSPTHESTALPYRRAGTATTSEAPEKLELPASGQLDAWDEFGFLDECDMTLREFCEVHDLPYPAEEEKFHIRPARPDEAGLFYAQHPSEDKSLVGRVTFVGDDAQEFTDAEAFLKCIREELPYFPTTGFHCEVLTDDPAVRKQVDDIFYDFFGEDNPHQIEDYQNEPEQDMTFGGV